MADKHQWQTDAEALEAIAERLAAARIGMPVTAGDGASALRLVAGDLRAAAASELTRQWVRAALSAPEAEAAEWSAYDYAAADAARPEADAARIAAAETPIVPQRPAPVLR
jgi:hypothetical protein